MLRAILVIVAAATISTFYLGGCKKGPSETDTEQDKVIETVAEYQEEVTETAAESEEEILKSSVEYQEDAEREITLANMENELRKIEEELKRDLAEEER